MIRAYAVLGCAFCVASTLMTSSTGAAVPGSNGTIAFNDLGGGVVVVSPTGVGARGVASGLSPAWSPDGTKLAFGRRLPGPCAPCNFELIVLDIKSERQAKLFEGATFDPDPSWSPDGRTIAFVNQIAGFDDIWLVNADGSAPRQLTFSRNNSAPAWSPDGELIAFGGFEERAGVSTEIFTIRPDGSGERALMQDTAIDLQPSWSPNGTTITFASDRGGPMGEFDVHAMNRDGSGIRRLTTGARLCPVMNCFVARLTTSWSPDGTQIAFTSHRDGDPAVYVMSLDGTAQRRVAGPGFAPDWQPTVELSLSMRGPSRVRTRATATYSIAARNASPRTATAVVVRATVPRGASAIGARSSLGTCTIARMVVCPVGNLPSGASVTVTLRLRVTRRGNLLNSASVNGAEADPADHNNRATVRTVSR
jgi:uncharacterized repeat protein (TIGR01451 family)